MKGGKRNPSPSLGVFLEGKERLVSCNQYFMFLVYYKKWQSI
jgi:hypothetical protein